MSYMFYNCSSLTSFVDSTDWVVEETLYMQYMFYNCSSLTSLDIRSWDPILLKDMNSMFSGCSLITSLTMGSRICNKYFFSIFRL